MLIVRRGGGIGSPAMQRLRRLRWWRGHVGKGHRQLEIMAVVEVKGAIGVERLRDFPLIENRVIFDANGSNVA